MNEHEMRLLSGALHRERLDEARRERLAREARTSAEPPVARRMAPARRWSRRFGLTLLFGRIA